MGFDIVLDDAENKQILIVQSKWIGKNRSVDIGDLEKFYSIHDRLMDENIVRTASQQTQDLLDNYADKVRDRYTVLLGLLQIGLSKKTNDDKNSYEIRTRGINGITQKWFASSSHNQI